MQEIARFESQQNEDDSKPKATKTVQRPKDTVKREQSATNNSNAVKAERVDPKKLNDLRIHIKLFL